MPDNPYQNDQQNGSDSPNQPFEQYQNQLYNQPGGQPERPKPNGLSVAALAISIVSYIVCCCNPIYLLGGSILAITLAICSKFIGEDTRKLHKIAIAAIIIGAIGIAVSIGYILIMYVWFPYMMNNDPEFRSQMEEMMERFGLDLSDYGYNLIYHVKSIFK